MNDTGKKMGEFLYEVVEPVRRLHAAFDMSMEMADHYALLTLALVNSIEPGQDRDWAIQCVRAYAKKTYSWSRTAHYIHSAQIVAVDEDDCCDPECLIHGAKGASKHGPN